MIYIDTLNALNQACAQWKTCTRIALDSEFMRVDTFYPKLALIQVNDGKQTSIVDPVRINRESRGEAISQTWQGFIDILVDPNITKILHSPSEDFDAFFSNLGVVPTPIFDTQLAAAMASMGGIMGYQKLVKSLLNIELDKGETRSDWMQRPLSDNQLHYAADDVNHLLEMADLLQNKLESLERWQWVQNDCQAMVSDWIETQEQGYGLERIKKAWMLKAHQLNILNQLLNWREARCREVNKPRGHIVSDAIMIEIAMKAPTSLKQLGAIKGIRQPTVRKDGEKIIEIIQQAQDMDKNQWPERLPRPFNQVAGEWFKKMRALVNKKAEALDIPPEFVARKRSLEQMLREAYPNGPFKIPQSLQGWRETVIGNDLLDLLKKLAK